MLPPYAAHSRTAAAAASDAISQPASSTAAYTATRTHVAAASCDSILRAPLCLSPATSRIATNGSRNAAAISQPLNVGAQMPTSGENASPTPAEVPPRPLASPYARTALMNATPTSGPIKTRKIHQARDASSSRHSFRMRGQTTPLGEAKKHLFQAGTGRGRATRGGQRAEFRERAFAADAAGADQDKAVAHPGRVGNLMDGEQHGAIAAGECAQLARKVARLAQVEPFERLVGHQQRLRREQPNGQQRALPLALRQPAERTVQQRPQLEGAQHVFTQ